MKKTLIALTLAGLSLPALAQQKAPEPDISISGNFGLFSDYRFRGISQTQKGAALQGGFDLTHKSGFYLGTWASNVNSDVMYLGGAGSEVDVYGGYRWSIGPLGMDIGLLRYIYPEAATLDANRATNRSSYDTTEAYVGVSYGPVSLKVSRSQTDQFSLRETAGSYYSDLTVTLPVSEGVSLVGHAGYFNDKRAKSDGGADGYDYKLGVNISLPSDFALGIFYVTNNGDIADGYKSNKASTDNKDLAASGAVVSISKTF